MIYTIIYDFTGAMVNYISCPVDVPQAYPSGGGAIVLSGPESSPEVFMEQNYVLNGIITTKKTNPASANNTTLTANGVDEVTISGIPAGTTALISGVISAGPETITDGEVVITSNTTGVINVTLVNAPSYLPWSCTINAV